ncbi:hypothetical protein M8C21_023445 [Ambrosia artemisiifolia]|uniref:Uncharacterized protein n=1 Tax=Ambrosia artemisiifolia TaxID=4212 RepID=A0AAD5GTL6_AMBAR|nr:hypothetical protein M8C21_023445 [Ambrosia artemisiifolia]
MATVAAAARSIFRSSSVRSTAARASSQAKAGRSPFRIGTQNNSLSNRIFRYLTNRHRSLLDLLSFDLEALTRLDEDRETKME